MTRSHTSLHPRPYQMQNQVQPYAWGTHDEQAFIPRLLGIQPQPGQPYAELWMGAHPNAPSSILVDGVPQRLDHWIAAHPLEMLGKQVVQRFSGKLPFLFKVLSAGEALSIQAHPNKAQAEMLHARDPEHYPDDNHKPEMAVALDSLTALMGIKPVSALAETLARCPELAAFIGPQVCADLREDAVQASTLRQRHTVQALFTALIQDAIHRTGKIVHTICTLADRLYATNDALSEEERLFLELRGKYPGADVGLLAIFLLNLVHLEAGQGVYIPAGVPHAYIRGNIIECMANSDNVVRVGLTPKFKDAAALLEILHAEPGPLPILAGKPGASQVVYDTPAAEFQISRLQMLPGSQKMFQSGDKPQILLITQGSLQIHWQNAQSMTETCSTGQSIFLPAALETYQMQAAGITQIFRVEIPLGK